MNIDKELLYKEFVQRENDFIRAPYNPELEFYSCIKEGNIEKIKKLCEEALCDKKGLGQLCDSPLQNIKYHFVVTAALAARYCIEGGLDMSKAYSVSDFYIRKADTCTNIKDVSDLHYIMCLDYTVRMNRLSKSRICSQPVVKCIDYICDKLHTRITIDSLADYVNLNPSYLSKLFKKETGKSISEYIQDKKIETASNMLIYSELSPAEISSILAFHSQSYFTEIFRKKMGMTPKKYQIKYFRSNTISNHNDNSDEEI